MNENRHGESGRNAARSRFGRIVSDPAVETCAGLLMAAASVWILLELPAAGREGDSDRSGYLGLLVLGVFVTLRSLALLAESVELLAKGTGHLRSHAPRARSSTSSAESSGSGNPRCPSI